MFFAITAIAELLLSVILYIYISNRAISIEIIKSFADSLHYSILSFFERAVINAGNVPLTGEVLIQTKALANEITNSLVGIVVSAALLLGYLAQRTSHSIYQCFELERLQDPAGAQIKAPLSVAIVFFTSHILSFTSSSSHAPSFMAAASLNISIILALPMIYTGLSALASLPKRLGVFAIPLWIGCVILSAVLSTSPATVLALLGAAITVFSSTDRWAEDHFGKGEGI